jgi:hypothetical protein
VRDFSPQYPRINPFRFASKFASLRRRKVHSGTPNG